jgi:hypothetical protein
VVSVPSGNERKPNYFIRQKRLPEDSSETEGLKGVELPAKLLERYLSERVPVPVAVVLEYNRRAEAIDEE